MRPRLRIPTRWSNEVAPICSLGGILEWGINRLLLRFGV